MKKVHVLFVFSALATVSYCGEQNYVPPAPTPPPASTTTSSTPNPNTTTASTTTKPTTPTKTTPTTPNTTTASTTTPTTTTTAAPTPAPGPIPDPPNVAPEAGTWTVNFTKPTNKTCIVSHIAIQVEIPFKRRDNQTKHAFVDVPVNASGNGVCSDNINTLALKWNGTNSIEFTFGRTNSSFNLSSIEISITPDNVTFPGYVGPDVIKLYHAKNEFSTSLKKSYKCAKEQTFNLTDSPATNLTIPRAFLHISHTQLQAFHNATGKSFADAEDCEPFDTPDVVPIAVGCALAALVIIVLVAYLIGRRRSQARGYLSMFTQTKPESDYIPMKNLNCFN